ncbi:MAG: pilus assembly protein TadG-related protein [Trebonia sp.]
MTLGRPGTRTGLAGAAARDERGQVLVWGALILALFLVPFLLFGLGASDAFNARSQLQSASDAAALAAAMTAQPVITLDTYPVEQQWSRYAECIIHAKGGACSQWVWWWDLGWSTDMGQVAVSDTAANLLYAGTSRDPGWAEETCAQLHFSGTCGSFKDNYGKPPGPGYALAREWFFGAGPAPCDSPCLLDPDAATTMGVESWERPGPIYWFYASDPQDEARAYLDANFQPSGSASIDSFTYAGCDPKHPTSVCSGYVTLTAHTKLLRNVARSGLGIGAYATGRPRSKPLPQNGS